MVILYQSSFEVVCFFLNLFEFDFGFRFDFLTSGGVGGERVSMCS